VVADGLTGLEFFATLKSLFAMAIDPFRRAAEDAP
jgi:hypothetical protein